jgi:protoporphyrinogen oxidase
MRRVDVVVVGAGPTGMGAACRLAEQSARSWLLLEAAPVPGGAAGSWRDDQGFLWDMGGHVLHSHFPYFDQTIADAVSEWSYPVRDPAVWVGDRFVGAPVQQHLDDLDVDVAGQIRKDLADRNPEDRENLAEWFTDQFGPTLTALFFEPFNYKMWAYPPRMMDHSWTSLRSGSGARNVPEAGAPAPARAVETFPYPRHGTGSMWADIMARLPQDHFRMNTRVTAVDLEAHVLTLDDGEQIGYGECISSIPLPTLLQGVAGHEDLRALVSGLHHSAVEVVGLGFEGPAPATLADRSWIYTADADIALHRATILSNYSDLVAGPGRWSILCEIGVSEFRPLDRATLVGDCLATMRRWGVESDPVSIETRFVPMGYPVPTLGRDEILTKVHEALEQYGVRSRGRFGGWRYESCNQDYSFMQGAEAVDAITTGGAEDVFWHPERF